MTTTTFNYSITKNPSFRVWTGISNRQANLYWEGSNFLIALWKLFEAKGKHKGLVRLEWV